MQKTIFIFLIGIIFYSCSNTKLLVSMKQKDLNPKAYNKLVVAALLPDDGNRLLLEETIVEELTESGIKSGISFFTFPLAAKKDIINNLTYTKEELKKVILDKIKKNKIDALMIISLLDAKKETHYAENRVVLTGYYDSVDFAKLKTFYLPDTTNTIMIISHIFIVQPIHQVIILLKQHILLK